MKHVKLVSAGVKAFEVTKKKQQGPYRLRQEGIHVLLGHLGKQVVKVTLPELHHIMKER